MIYLTMLMIFTVIVILSYELAPKKFELSRSKKNIFRIVVQKTAKFNSRFRIADYRKKILILFSKSALNFILTPDEFLAVKELFSIGLFLIFFVFFGNPVLSILLGVSGFFIPDLWLKERVEKRKKQIIKELPYFIDMLILVVEAGLDAVAGMNKILKKTRTTVLSEELKITLEEIRMGKTREEAFGNLSRRLDIPEINSFTCCFQQSFSYGVPISGSLKNQSEKISMERFMRAEKTANQAAVKMLFPMVIFIFPVVFIVLFGPVFIQLIK